LRELFLMAIGKAEILGGTSGKHVIPYDPALLAGN
jgi:hypothetical protein